MHGHVIVKESVQVNNFVFNNLFSAIIWHICAELNELSMCKKKKKKKEEKNSSNMLGYL